jgi:inorganic triphosphatase YgiF
MKARREFELKLQLTKSDLDRIRRNSLLKPAKGAEPSCKTLRSIYFDTPDHRLHAEGLSLRVRDLGSHNWVQTVKAETALASGLSTPIEVEDKVDGAQPDLDRIANKDVRRQVRKAVSGSLLLPAFETVIERTTHRLRRHSSVMELALDEGEARAGEEKAEIREAELELISGEPSDLLETAQALFSKNRVHPSELTKAERGYRLSRETLETGLEPLYARMPDVHPGQTVGQAFAEILRVAGEQIIGNRRVVLATDEPEGAHQLRVGLTRLRSALRMLRPLASPSLLKEFEADAREVARIAGELRDADVLIGDIYAPIAGEARDTPGFDTLYNALQAHRLAKRDGARSGLRSEHWSRLLLSLTLWPSVLEAGGEFQEPIEKLGRKAIQARWKNSAKYGRRLDELNLEQRHAMRRSLKKLRYTIEFFVPLYSGQDTEQFIKRLKKLQDVFGYINDVRMAGELRAICTGRCADDPNAYFAAGNVLGRHEAAVPGVWQNAGGEWRRLEKSVHFWQ